MLSRHPFQALQLELQQRGIARELRIESLAAGDVERYLALEFPDHAFPAEFGPFVHARTEGHPLFMADLLRTLRDRQIVSRQQGTWRLARPIDELRDETPASTRSMIELKIGRLSEEDRRLLVAASVQGHEFEAAIVARALALDSGDVEEALDRLDRMHALVRRVREVEFPDRTLTVRYRFAHALYQNALYGSLGPARRASISRAVAQAIVATHGEQAPAHASDLAFLFEAARDFSRAAEFYAVASERARQVFAYREALALATRGMEMLKALPDTPERPPRELAHLMAIAVATHPLKSYAAPELDELYARLRQLCDQIGEQPAIFGAVCALGAFHFMRAEVRSTHELVDRMFRIAAQTGHPVMEIWSTWAYGASFAHLGEDLPQAHERLERGVALYNPAFHSGLMIMTGFDAGIGCTFQDARVLWTLGYPDRSLQRLEQALSLARSTAHPLMILFTRFFEAFVRQLRDEPQRVLAVTAEALPLVDQYGYPHLGSWLGMMHGWAVARTGDPVAGERRIRESIGVADAIGLSLMRPHAIAMLAETVAAQGRLDEALEVLEDARRTGDRTEERYYATEVYRLIGEIRQKRGAPLDEIEPPLRDAVAIARAQQARGFELRAATSLARLLAGQGRPDEARVALAPVVEWFTEGFDTPDYVAARDVLESARS
jgi:tetratricopeptide (TPR) repeat protein